jgi:hypothetical protein
MWKMKTINFIPLVLVAMVGLYANAYSPEGTSVTGTTSTATGNDTTNDNGGTLASDPQPTTTTNTNTPTDAGTAGSGSCKIVTLGTIDEFLRSNPTKEQIDDYNKQAYAAGESGFVEQVAEQGDQNSLATLMWIDKVDQYDATHSEDVLELYANEVPDGVDASGFGGVQNLGIQKSVSVVAPTELYNEMHGKPGVASTWPGVLGDQGSLIIVNDQYESDIQRMMAHEMYHAGTEALYQELQSDPRAKEDEKLSGALEIMESVRSQPADDLFPDLFPLGIDNTYYNTTLELLAYCSGTDGHCDNVGGIYAQKMKEDNMTDDQIRDYLMTMESDPTLSGVMRYLDKAATHYLEAGK